MFKCIIFDVGGTLMEGSLTDFMNKSYIVIGRKDKFYTDNEVVFDPGLNSGTVGYEECFSKVFGNITDEQFKQIVKLWTTNWAMSKEMEELVRALKKNYRLAILSNSDLLNSENYAKKGWYSYFDPIILSHEVGIVKPDQRIYDLAMEKIGLAASECILVDDQIDAIKPAIKMGIATILYKNIKQLKNELESHGIIF